MTYGQFRFDLAKLYPGLDPDMLDGWCNDRYQRYLEHTQWKDLEKTATITSVIAQSAYAAPADFRLPITGKNPNTHREVTFISRGELDRIDPDRLVKGPPQVYALVDASTLELYPVPTVVENYTIRYTRTVARFASSDSAMVLLPWISIEGLKAGVKADACEFRKDYAAADRNEAKFMAEMTKSAVSDVRRRGPQRIRMSPKFVSAPLGGSDHRRQMP